MKVYVFGNEDLDFDSAAIKIAKKVENSVEGFEFIYVKPNQDLPFANEKNVVILDTVCGIKDITLITEDQIQNISPETRTTAHDFDLGFQLRYLKKIGKLEKVIIIGLPMEKDIDYLRIQSILRKLVAQDIHGS
jgi:Ni,Fe-hydrogenase maturation factor